MAKSIIKRKKGTKPLVKKLGTKKLGTKKPSTKLSTKKTGGSWSIKYKKSINCNRPKGFSQKQHCKYGRKNGKPIKKKTVKKKTIKKK